MKQPQSGWPEMRGVRKGPPGVSLSGLASRWASAVVTTLLPRPPARAPRAGKR